MVFLDCDSTLSAVEGIDELARWSGVLEQTASLTRAAMEGALPLESVYAKRLELIRPSRTDADRLGRLYVERVVDGAENLVSELRRAGCSVHVLSGGLLPAVSVLAAHVGVPERNVHAVDTYFDPAGHYAGFDASSPLARSGGKRTECERVLEAHPGRAAMVGDGVTDLEAVPPCELMVGFGGVVSREAVRRGCGAWVPGPSLAGALRHLLEEAA